MPFSIISGQHIENEDFESDTAVQSELDIKYDSILGRAASALSASAYQQSINLYKEASGLKPMERYPYKMINYVEDLAAKQRRADDLRRKAQISNYLIRANQAVVDARWDSAKYLFNKILTLEPDKADMDYAKAKIEAIDLELQRIAQRTPPPKEAPPVVIPPKNRREARAQRKIAERNASIASAKTNASTPTLPSTNTAAANEKKISYQLLKQFSEDFRNASNINWTINSNFSKVEFLQDDEKVEAFYDSQSRLIGTSRHISPDQLPKEARKLFATAYNQYKIKEVIHYEGAEDVAYYISTEDDRERVVFKFSGIKDISVFSRGSVEKNVATAAADATKGIQQKPVNAPSAKNTVAAPQTTKEIQPKPLEGLTTKSGTVAPPATKETPRRIIQAPSTGNNGAQLTNAAKGILQTPSDAALPIANVSKNAVPAGVEINKNPAQASLSKNVPITTPGANGKQQKLTDTALTTPSSVEIRKNPAQASSSKNISTTTPVTDRIPQRQADTALPARVSNNAAPSGVEIRKNPPQSLSKNVPTTTTPPVTNRIPQKKTDSLRTSNLSNAAAPSGVEIRKNPAQASLSKNVSTTVPRINDTTTIPGKNDTTTVPRLTEAQQRALKNTLVVENETGSVPLTTEIGQKPLDDRLKLYDSSDYIKLVCTDISFIGSNAYIKVLIQNHSSTTDFPTDTLQVSLKKNNGTVKKLEQRFTSSFPVVRPLGEYVLVSLADASAGIEKDDIFIFEMRNKITKTKLAVEVPWKLYNQNKNF